MGRNTLEQQLAEAERHVALGRDLVARQRELVARLERDGFPVEEAKRLLANFEHILTLHVQDRDRLRRELEVSR